MAQLIEAYEPIGAVTLSKEFSQEFLECLLLQTYEHRMSPEDRAKRDAEEVLKDENVKAELMKKTFSINISGERVPRVISLASFFPDSNGGENGNSN